MSDQHTQERMTARHFRDVLGQLPTGVVAITSRSVGDGEPIGMTLGSFISVSLDPPLVAFLPDHRSSTFPRIQETGRFCANILASGQKGVSQAFATKGADRFADVAWTPSPQTGSPILEGSLAWVDCEIVQIHTAGDHDIVIGRVLDMEMGDQGFPLVFFQGGYGTFRLRSLVLATRGALNESVRIADALRPDLEAVSAEFGVECRVFALEANELVVVMTTGYSGPADRVGMQLPFCAPFGLTFAAWGSPAVRDAWYKAAPGGLSPEQQGTLGAELDRVRAQGWTASLANGPLNEVGRILEDIAAYGSTPRLERELLAAGRALTVDPVSEDHLASDVVEVVRSISVPVLRGEVPVLHLVARAFPPEITSYQVVRVRDRLIAAAREAR